MRSLITQLSFPGAPQSRDADYGPYTSVGLAGVPALSFAFFSKAAASAPVPGGAAGLLILDPSPMTGGPFL